MSIDDGLGVEIHNCAYFHKLRGPEKDRFLSGVDFLVEKFVYE